MSTFRLTRSARANLDDILVWSAENFGLAAELRYSTLIIQAIKDVAQVPGHPLIVWERVGRREVGFYHISHSRRHVPNPDDQVAEPRHYLVFRHQPEDVIEILGIIHERMLRRKAVREIFRKIEKVGLRP
ncbi:type II toxin-antitoxin system RelE/ParE family toxin [Nitrospirillum viridazoti]|uniref:type II toxin-antitoxin system RelE/ParE family toxin n=1 Tax=Nitrospirillum viridazoti TaxID=3144925 RepID=UPI0016425C17|nr:type II toxin-antitoxin system RelE/ParE family toxin [Nitrospirillum amazonense]